MRYLGGKHWIAGELASVILPRVQGRRVLEPFCGGLSMTVALQPAQAADFSSPLISLVQSVREGWDPPGEVSEELYNEVKTAGPEHPLYNYVGLCATWGGKWWGGYARGHKRQVNPVGAARTSLLRKVEATRAVEFYNRSYTETPVQDGDVLYCDPPYKDTTVGYAAPPFDSEAFWDWCRWASGRGAEVFVSEFTAPDDILILSEFSRKTNVREQSSGGEVSDRLYHLETEEPVMATRKYPRLSIEDFGARLLDLGDLDPVYVALCRAEWPEEQRSRFLVAYWCLYHVGLSCWLSDQSDEAFWRQLSEAAVNDRPSPVGGRWPRAAERRHWRGANALKSVEDLTRRYETAQQMVDYVSMAEELRTTPHVPYEAVANRVQRHIAFGPWIAFKVADMLERCCEVPVLFGLDDAMYDSPRQAALRLFWERTILPPEAKIKDENAVVSGVVRHLIETFKDHDAPPGGGRKVGYQEVETILCKWQSHMNGHYPVGNDLIEIAEGLEAWAEVSPAAKEFLHHLPDVPTEADSPVS
jgi:hypothetical protein